jgi:hypothetical protein
VPAGKGLSHEDQRACFAQQNPRQLMSKTTAEIPPELIARLAHPTVRLSGLIDEAAAASFLSQVLPVLDVPGSIVVEIVSPPPKFPTRRI